MRTLRIPTHSPQVGNAAQVVRPLRRLNLLLHRLNLLLERLQGTHALALLLHPLARSLGADIRNCTAQTAPGSAASEGSARRECLRVHPGSSTPIRDWVATCLSGLRQHTHTFKRSFDAASFSFDMAVACAAPPPHATRHCIAAAAAAYLHLKLQLTSLQAVDDLRLRVQSHSHLGA
jgi:hypothetical protein